MNTSRGVLRASSDRPTASSDRPTASSDRPTDRPSSSVVRRRPIVPAPIVKSTSASTARWQNSAKATRDGSWTNASMGRTSMDGTVRRSRRRWRRTTTTTDERRSGRMTMEGWRMMTTTEDSERSRARRARERCETMGSRTIYVAFVRD